MSTTDDEELRPEDNQEPFDEWLDRAVETRRAPSKTVDLLKNAFTWRTIDAELMALSYDSAEDLTTVRDGGRQRTLEFAAGSLSVVIEIEPSGIVQGQVFGLAGSPVVVTLRGIDSSQGMIIDEFGSFEFPAVSVGHYRIELTDPPLRSAAFLVG